MELANDFTAKFSTV